MRCAGCGQSESKEGLAEWQAAHETAAGDSLAGWSLLWRAFGVFVLPAVLALVGAGVAGAGEVRRFVGLAAGFGAGILVSSICAIAGRKLKRPGREEQL